MAARLVECGRRWVSTELKGNDVGRFREYCRDMHLNFETSDAGFGYTHFEVLCSENEMSKANAELLETLPHRIVFNDLALVYKIWFGSDNGSATAKVTTQMMNTWGVTEEDLFKVAKVNTPLIMPVKFCHMAEIMAETMGMPEEIVKEMMGDTPMYVLSNEQKMFGATSIMYSGVLERIADELDSDLAIIPSSIHEVIILPLTDDMTDDFVNGMIGEVNGNEVAEDEVLGTHVYKYFRR